MSFLGGLGEGLARGVGAAAQGYLGGQVAGEKEAYRREQLAASLAQKKEALAQQRELVGLRRKEADPRKAQVDTARALFTELSTAALKPDFQAYRLRYPDFDRKYAAAQGHLAGVIRGTEDLDPAKITWLTELEHPGAGGGDQGLGGAAGDQAPDGAGLKTPAGLGGVGSPVTFHAEPNPRLDSFLKPPAPPAGLGMAPRQPLLADSQVQIPARRELPPPTFGSVPAHILANEVLQDHSDFQPFGPEPAPVKPRPAPAAAPSGPPEPQTPMERFASRYFDLLQQGPEHVEREPGMTDKDYRAAVKEARAEWTAETDRLGKSLSILPDAEFKRLRNLYAPELNRQKVVGGVVKIENTRATTKQTQALTPVKVEKGHVDIQKGKAETAAIPRRLDLQGRSVAASERNAATGEGRLAETKAYHQQLTDRAQNALTRANAKFADTADRTILQSGLKVLGAKKRTAAGSEVPFYSDAERGKWATRMNDALARINERRGAAGAGTTAALGRSAPTPAASRPADVDEEVFRIVGRRMADFGTLYKKSPAAARPQLLKAYEAHAHHPWKGAR